MQPSVLLRKARDRAGLTQQELAMRAGTSQAAVSRYEGSAAIPSLPVLERLLMACGFELEANLVPLEVDDSLIDLMLSMSVEDRLRTARNFARVAVELQRDPLAP